MSKYEDTLKCVNSACPVKADCVRFKYDEQKDFLNFKIRTDHKGNVICRGYVLKDVK